MGAVRDEFDTEAPIDSGWESAGADSHLESFRLINRAFTGQATSIIKIRFRAKGKQRGAQYRYEESHGRAAEIFFAMQLRVGNPPNQGPGVAGHEMLWGAGNKGREEPWGE